MDQTKNDIDRYSLNIEWSPEDQGFVATCPSFPGLSTFGETRDEVMEKAQTALELFIEDYEKTEEGLPEPKQKEEYSGQTRVRMPKYLHRELSREADRQDVSLNTLIVSYLQKGV